ncbi:hypothetical protein KEM55_007058 [Ascosphaera atra]|nr:hypothetical protein KEM55_007058 [Ascosphaera atra]
MARGFRNTHELFLEAMRRILGADEVKDGLTPVEDQIASYSQESTVLFEEEKQNLFVDEIRESGRWSVILSGVKDVGLDNSLMHSLYVWAHSGLVALTESAQLKEYGGILGWSSKPEVFVLGMRVLYATYALLLRPDESGLAYNREELAQTLCDFILMGRARMVNESWNLLAEEILGKWKMSIY